MISSITHLSPVAQNCTKRAVGSSSKPVSFQESLQSSRAARDRVETRLSDGKLSAEELAVLSEKYDPDHMTQEQYDAFLDELESKGILSKEDKMLVKKTQKCVSGRHLNHTGLAQGGRILKTMLSCN